VRDFAPITLIAQVPNVLVMPPETAARYRIKSVRDLVEYAREESAKLNYASAATAAAATWRRTAQVDGARVDRAHSVRRRGAGSSACWRARPI